VRRSISARTTAQSDIQRAANVNTAAVPWLEHLRPFKSDGLLEDCLVVALEMVLDRDDLPHELYSDAVTSQACMLAGIEPEDIPGRLVN
jgi:hypothetical protein